MLAFRLFTFIYLLSGAAALVYEVVWLRLLTQHFGQTEAAVSTVLASFMGGLALGSGLLGRVAPRLSPKQALVVYAALEASIGLFALLVPPALRALSPWLAGSYADGDGNLVFSVVRLLLTLIVLLVPTTAIGATFPAAIRWLEGQPDHGVGRTSWLYALNTLGAAAGALGAGFAGLPNLGLTRTALIGVLLNLAAAGGAAAVWYWLAPDHAPDAPADVRTPKTARGKAGPPPSRSTARFWLAGSTLLLSGFVALVYEVVWTRLLVLALGPTVYAFSAMLVAFIVGLALGSALAARLLARLEHVAVAALGASLLLGALGSLAAAYAVPALPLLVASATASPTATFESVLLREAGLIGAVMLPMAMAFGAAFPFGLATALAGRHDAADRVAILYTLNTAGAIAGSLVGGFVLVPLLGLRQSLMLASALAIAGGTMIVILAFEATFRARMIWISVAIATAVFGLTLPEFDPRLLSSGAYKYAGFLSGPDVRLGLEAGTLLYYEEGLAGTVSVRRVAGTTSLAINGKVDASNGADMLTQKLLAHVPLLLHPQPKDVCILGLGSGVTLGSALRHPITRADALEISPEVAEAASYFAAENHGALSDPRTNLVLGDGRTHLKLSSRQYDVIISEPSNPWMSGIANLFTREMFQAARARLKPRGVFCQWAHTYDMSDRDLRSIVATFESVFPDGSLWLVGEGDVLLIGSTDPVTPMLQTIAAEWDRPGVAADLAEVDVHSPFGLLSSWLGGGDLLRAYAGDAPLQTDDWPQLEFTAPRAVFGRRRDDNVGQLRGLAATLPRPDVVTSQIDGATAQQLRQRGAMYLRADAFEAAYADFKQALGRAPSDTAALDGLVSAGEKLRKQDDLMTWLKGRYDQDPTNVPVTVTLARLLAATGRPGDGVRLVDEALTRAPNEPRLLGQLAAIHADLGDVERLSPVVSALGQVAPAAPDTAYFEASLHFLRGELPQAIAAGERVLLVKPDDARTLNLLGAAQATLGNRERARAYFQASLKADPQDPTSYTNLGTFELESANAEAAAGLFGEALSIDPTSPTARAGLVRALRGLGQDERAARLERQAAPVPEAR